MVSPQCESDDDIWVCSLYGNIYLMLYTDTLYTVVADDNVAGLGDEEDGGGLHYHLTTNTTATLPPITSLRHYHSTTTTTSPLPSPHRHHATTTHHKTTLPSPTTQPTSTKITAQHDRHRNQTTTSWNATSTPSPPQQQPCDTNTQNLTLVSASVLTLRMAVVGQMLLIFVFEYIDLHFVHSLGFYTRCYGSTDPFWINRSDLSFEIHFIILDGEIPRQPVYI